MGETHGVSELVTEKHRLDDRTEIAHRREKIVVDADVSPVDPVPVGGDESHTGRTGRDLP